MAIRIEGGPKITEASLSKGVGRGGRVPVEHGAIGNDQPTKGRIEKILLESTRIKEIGTTGIKDVTKPRIDAEGKEWRDFLRANK